MLNITTPYFETCLETKLHVVFNFLRHFCRNAMAGFFNSIPYSYRLFGHTVHYFTKSHTAQRSLAKGVAGQIFS
jgi:hypothetical protein